MPFALMRRKLGAERGIGAAPQEVLVRVRGGYLPSTIHARAGSRLRIVFRREESRACSEQVVFPSFGKSATLPEGEDVAVDLLPEEPGIHEFTCGMGMLRGRLVVASGGESVGPPTGVEPQHTSGGERS